MANLLFSEYELDEMLAASAELLCPTFVSDGQECSLPLGPGVYGGDPALVITIPEIAPGYYSPNYFISLTLLYSELGILLGNKAVLYADATITGPDGEVLCIYMRVQVKTQ